MMRAPLFYFATSLLITSCLLQQVKGENFVFEIDNKRPEGMTMVPTSAAADALNLTGDGPFALVGEFWYGGVKALDLNSGNITQVVNSSPTFGERGSIGLAYDADNDVILVCSGGEFVGPSNVPALFAYDAMTGKELAKCLPDFDATFINDVTAANGTAFATDSFANRIMVLEVEATRQGECIVSSNETPADRFQSDGETWTTNGILAYKNGLLIVQEAIGGVCYVDLSKNNTVTSVIPDGSVVKADGLCLSDSDDILYVAQNYENGPLTGWQLSIDENGTIIASNLGSIESDYYDSPSSCGVSGDIVYASNIRFSIGMPAEAEDTLSTFNETFAMVGVDRKEFSDSSPAPPSPSPTTMEDGASMPTSNAWNRFSIAASLFFSMALWMVWMYLCDYQGNVGMS